MLTSRSKPESPAHEVVEGIRVIRSWFPRKSPLGWAVHTFVTVPHYQHLARSADILHAQTFASALPGMIAKRRLGKPLVLTLHTSHFLRLARKPAWKPVLRAIIASADRLLAASEEIRDVALSLYRHPRAEALTNGVDTNLFRPIAPTLPPAPGRRRIVVPRRLFEKNGVEYLVRALPLLAARLDVEALLVGEGPERSRLEALARELQVTSRVIFMGARANPEMPGLLCSADAVVIPSLMEATSVAALEAMSCARAVAASNVGGLPQIIDESVGTLFRPGDPQDLADRLYALLSAPDLELRGARGRERVVARWSNDRLARRHIEIYQELLNEAR
jgi:glycosyltransferase involved in cell wall biosynthesis